MSLAEGLVLLIEKQLAKQYERKVDAVRVVEGVVPAGVPLVDAKPELARRIVTQHTSGLGLRTTYRDRVKVFREQLAKIEPEVVDHISRTETQACLIQDKEATCTVKMQVMGAGGGGAAAAGRSHCTVRKKDVVDHLQAATRRALSELGVNPDRPYDVRLATQIMSHVQFVPLVSRHYTSSSSQSASSASSASSAQPASSGQLRLKAVVKFSK